MRRTKERRSRTTYPPSKDISIELMNRIDKLLHSRWWFASTGFPLTAGTFGPMASAFSICALVQDWRVVMPGETEGIGDKVKDPQW